jgi:hypothetical protein
LFSQECECCRCLRKPFENACTIAGIEYFRIHELAHCFAGLVVMSGASLSDVQKLLGHQDIEVACLGRFHARHHDWQMPTIPCGTDGFGGCISSAPSTGTHSPECEARPPSWDSGD